MQTFERHVKYIDRIIDISVLTCKDQRLPLAKTCI